MLCCRPDLVIDIFLSVGLTTIAPIDCGPKKIRPIALAEVLMKLAESCVIEQHIEKLFKGVEPTNLGLGTPDAAALMVRIVRGCANDMAMAPKVGQDADVVLPIDVENAYGRAFRSTYWKPRGARARS